MTCFSANIIRDAWKSSWKVDCYKPCIKRRIKTTLLFSTRRKTLKKPRSNGKSSFRLISGEKKYRLRY